MYQNLYVFEIFIKKWQIDNLSLFNGKIILYDFYLNLKCYYIDKCVLILFFKIVLKSIEISDRIQILKDWNLLKLKSIFFIMYPVNANTKNIFCFIINGIYEINKIKYI